MKNKKRNYVLKAAISFIMYVIILLRINAQSPVVKVDFDMYGRPESEVNEPGYIAWPVATASSISQTIDGVTFTFSFAGNGTALGSSWYKAGIQAPYYVRLADDGLSVEDGINGTEIQMTISGLPAGNHTLLLYHNNVDNPETNTFCPVDIYVNGNLSIDNLIPSVRVLSNYDAETSYHSFSVSSGENVVIRIVTEPSSTASNKNVVINGFELNVPNSKYQAYSPVPANNDMHVDADNGALALSWTAASSAVSHDVYIGTNSSDLENATHSSAEFKGNQSYSTYNLSGLYSMNTYYWRIDEIGSDGTVTKGNTWIFRPRQLAFPGAGGYGRFAIGGRGGVVVHVTNLNDSGAGSLREAIESDIGPRTIVFDISGIITLSSRLVLNSKYITVAGQTAPGKGICIKSAPFGMSGAEDAVIQNLRVRLGAGETYDGMGMTGSNHCIIDHSSISWTIDEAFSSRNGKNITLQRTLISEALNIAGHVNYPEGTMHGYAASIGGDIGSFHHNLLAHCYGRNWSLAGGLDANGYFAGRLDIFNNVVYNWGSRTTDGGAHEVNFVGNYYKPGASSSIFYALNATYEDDFPGTQQYYFSGNVMPGYFDESNQTDGRRSVGEFAPPSYTDFVSSPFFPSYATVQSAEEAYKSVLSDVGCTQPVFDDHDQRIILETRNGTYTYSGSVSGLPGMPDNESDVGGYEDYPTVYRDSNWDSDKDGLPDWWETNKGLNINSGSGDFSDANADNDGNGYTNLEEYLQWLSNPHYFITNTGSVTINLGQMFMGYTNSPSYSTSNIVNGSVGIQSGNAVFTPNSCGMASFELSVADGAGDGMTKQVVVFVDGDCSGTSYSLTTSISGQGSVSPSSGTFASGETVSITAIPSDGWQFDGWGGDVSGTSNPISVTMNSDKNITAIFTEEPINGTVISIQENTLGFCSVYGTIDNNNAGFTGDGFANTTNAVGSGIDYKISIGTAGNYTLTAMIANGSGDRPANILVDGSSAGTLSMPATGGWTSWSTTSTTIYLNAGTHNLRLEATTSEGLANVDYISITGTDPGASDCNATVNTYTLTVSISGSGTVSGTGAYEEGALATLTATPASGWQFDGWSGELSGSENPVSLTVNSDVTITALFSETFVPVTLTIQENETGFCSVDGTIDNNNSGFTGDGFANTTNSIDNGITWSINVPSAGNCNVLWRYSNGGSTDRNAQIMINGDIVVSDISMPSTGSWTSWAETTTSQVYLEAGTNLVRLQATTSSGLANIDYLAITAISPVGISCTGLKHVGTQNTGFENEISLYPNPVQGDKMNIKGALSDKNPITVLIYDQLGQVIFRNEFGIIEEGDFILEIPVDDIQSGIYHLQIKSEKAIRILQFVKE